jgi:hypothetical protein
MQFMTTEIVQKAKYPLALWERGRGEGVAVCVDLPPVLKLPGSLTPTLSQRARESLIKLFEGGISPTPIVQGQG